MDKIEKQMKDFTYNNNKTNLDPNAFHWLTDMGLKETQWILDTKCLSIDYHLVYKNWINK